MAVSYRIYRVNFSSTLLWVIIESGHGKTCLMLYANNKGTDQPAHPRSLISAFVVRCLDSVMSLVSVTKISSLILASVAEQANLSLTWSETPEDTFSYDVAQLLFLHCPIFQGSCFWLLRFIKKTYIQLKILMPVIFHICFVYIHMSQSCSLLLCKFALDRNASP